MANATKRGDIRAYRIVRWAKDLGTLTPEPCEVCGEEKVDAHHDDYNKPLEVHWLCRLHHVEWHKDNDPIPYEKG